MEVFKEIPQSFFELFARLVPGLAAFALWLGLFGGAREWARILEAFTAGHLNADNVTVNALFLSLSLAYVAGQLVAPFGKGMQRIAEHVGKTKKPPGSAEGKANDYDWLRANRPPLGALVAKIRAEHTMFHSLSAVFVLALAIRLATGPAGPGAPLILLVLGVACAVRGYAVKKTLDKTARKLRAAIEPPPSGTPDAGAASRETT